MGLILWIYNACGNWKNKGSAVCHSNMIRVEKANSVVYQRIEEILNDDKVFNEVLSRINREHSILKKNAFRERNIQEKERERLTKRMTKNHEAYEDGLITREEFLWSSGDLRLGAVFLQSAIRINWSS